MDNETMKKLLRITLWCLIGLPLGAVLLIPFWFVIQGQWNQYIQWLPTFLSISRFGWFLCIILGPIMAYVGDEGAWLSYAFDSLIMYLWGIPKLLKALLLIASTPLAGLELQRTLLVIILIKSFAVGASLSLKKTITTSK